MRQTLASISCSLQSGHSMAVFNFTSFSINSNAKIPPDIKISISQNPTALLQFGFNMNVELCLATAFQKPGDQTPRKTIQIVGHFDTGASMTSIDEKLAPLLGLVPTGYIDSQTASGISRMPTYAIDLSFPGTRLKSYINIPIGSCKLPFNLASHKSDPNDIRNFGMLIGRDVMSRWEICWNGTNSTVTVCD